MSRQDNEPINTWQLEREAARLRAEAVARVTARLRHKIQTMFHHSRPAPQSVA